MNQTQRYGLTQYELQDKFRITQLTDSLNKDMEILDTAVYGKMEKPTNGNGASDQVLRSNGDGTSSWGDNPSGDEIARDVEAWLEEHVFPETEVVIDSSLSIEGAAADAKATGDAISAVETEVSGIGSATNISGNRYRISFR